MPTKAAAMSGHEDERHESGVGAMSSTGHADLSRRPSREDFEKRFQAQRERTREIESEERP